MTNQPTRTPQPQLFGYENMQDEYMTRRNAPPLNQRDDILPETYIRGNTGQRFQAPIGGAMPQRNVAPMNQGTGMAMPYANQILIDGGLEEGTDPRSLQESIVQAKGRFVIAEFIMGTSPDLAARAGILTDVGTNFLILFDPCSETVMSCELYSLKFLTVYPLGVPSIEDLCAFWQNRRPGRPWMG